MTTPQPQIAGFTAPRSRPLWFRVLRAPVGQLLRGRILPAQTIDDLLATSGLGPSVTHLIREVVKATKLWPHERHDVALELIEHFQDALDAGRTSDAAAAAFGDHKIAAKLIRRAKIRNRSRLWHLQRAAFRATGILLLLMIATYLILLVRLLTATPSIRHDYLAEINAPVDRIPVEQRAWPIWREALLALPKPPKPDELSLDAMASTLDWAGWPENLPLSRRAIELAREAAKLPHLGAKLGLGLSNEFTLANEPDAAHDASDLLGDSLLNIRLDPLGSIRTLSSVLLANARAAGRNHDAEQALLDITTAIKLAEHLAEVPTLISDLVSLNCFAIARLEVDRILRDQQKLFSDAQLAELSHRLAAFRGGVIRVRVDNERVFFQDMLQRLYTDDGRGDGRLTRDAARNLAILSNFGSPYAAEFKQSVSMLMPVMTGLDAGRAETLRKYNEIMDLQTAWAALPFWQRGDDTPDMAFMQLQRSPLSAARYWVVVALCPAIASSSDFGVRATQERDGTLTAIALELFKRRNGRHPATLNQLVPRYLPSAPIDQFDGNLIRYRIDNDRPLLYSIGADGEDQGGVRPKVPGGSHSIRFWKQPSMRGGMPNADRGDWILWPPCDDE